MSSQAYNYNNIRRPLPIIGLGQTREFNLPGQNISITVSKYFWELQFTMALWEVGSSIIMFSILRKTTSPHRGLEGKVWDCTRNVSNENYYSTISQLSMEGCAANLRDHGR